MIEIRKESSSDIGVTNGCITCGKNTVDTNHEIILFDENKHGVAIVLCEDCMQELATILQTFILQKVMEKT